METLHNLIDIPWNDLVDGNDQEIVANHLQKWFDELREDWILDKEFTVTTVRDSALSMAMGSVQLKVSVKAMPKRQPGHCENCGGPIVITIFKGGRWCSDDCRKELE